MWTLRTPTNEISVPTPLLMSVFNTSEIGRMLLHQLEGEFVSPEEAAQLADAIEQCQRAPDLLDVVAWLRSAGKEGFELW